MLSRILMVGGVILILVLSAFFFASNGSYQNSLQARVYYFLGNYDEAHELATKAHQEDRYNKMAFTVMTQSKIALKYENYIKQGNAYFKNIDAISAQKEITLSDKSKVKLICEIMIEEYETLVPTPLTDETLQENAKKMVEKFKQLYEELF